MQQTTANPRIPKLRTEQLIRTLKNMGFEEVDCTPIYTMLRNDAMNRAIHVKVSKRIIPPRQVEKILKKSRISLPAFSENMLLD